jgi:8-amino-7-oxononanoate synthase
VKHPLAFLDEELARLERQGLLRTRPAPWSGRPSFSSNDYLGLARRSVSVEGPAGAGASRLVTGEMHEHQRLESTLAAWLGMPACLCFPTGHATNVGLLSALARPGDLVVSDALNHASIIDGVRLARAAVEITPHLDVGAVERALASSSAPRKLVVVESYYSMDADSPDLIQLRRITNEHGAALIVDEAHALGVLGGGRGLSAAAGIVPDALVGTLGKAIGVQGGFVAGSETLIAWLWNKARTFVFSTGMSPLIAKAALANVEVVRGADAARAEVARLAELLRSRMKALGEDVRGYGHILPWWIGSPERALAVARALRERGFEVQAIRPPTVPEGTSRIRLTVTARHTTEDVEALASAIREIVAHGLAGRR